MNDRDSRIIEAYIGGCTASELSRLFGLSEPRIRQIVSGIKKERRPATYRPISDVHKRLGLKVYDYRFDRNIKADLVAKKLGWSLSKLRQLEKGLVDPTLLDLQDITTFMNINIGDLLNNVINRQQA